MTETNKDTKDKKKKGLSAFWLKLRDTFSSTLMKAVVGLLFTAISTFLWRELYYNPVISFELSGRVVLHDYPETGVEAASIYVEGETFEEKTNEDGVFVGTLRIRKRSGAVIIHCEKYGFRSEHKTVYVPLEKKPSQRTYFTLKPL